MLSTFPGTGSIPPACFYRPDGLAGYLNAHPQYKLYFAGTGAFPTPINPEYVTSSLSSLGYDLAKVPLCSNVTTLSQHQAQKYGDQINLFQKVYAYNSNAYVNYIENGIGPVYYTFNSYKEKNEYAASVSLINKLYPFQAMANASTLNWQVPFPINM